VTSKLSGSFGLRIVLVACGFALLAGCDDNENKAKDVIGATVKDPLALEVRHVHASYTAPTTICGEFNAKNSYGGYVGFKPFAIDTHEHDRLTELDDDAGADDRDQYYLVCGDEMQRAEANANIQARKKSEEQAERDALAAAKRALEAELQTRKKAAEQAKKDAAAAARAVAAMFSLPKLPTAIEQMYCHMGECRWEQITGVSDIEKKRSEVLRAVHFRTTATETPEGQDYPARLDPHASVTFAKSTSYVLCSLTRPTSFWRDRETQSYVKTPLHIVSPSGFEYSAVVEYLMACHGAKPGSNEAKHPAELGYIDRTNELPQTHIADPKQVFDSAD
jgi:hypothetical protein